jgi:hypothetical protein
MSDASRQSLADQQSGLIDALAAAGPPPAGFDAARVGLAAQTLVNKRARSVAKAWPALARALDGEFESRFARYAADHPLPPGGALDDGQEFAEHLLATGEIPDVAHLELLFHRSARGFPARFARLCQSGRIVVVFRTLWRRICCISVGR